MPNITITVDGEFVELLAEAIARRSLANAGMLPGGADSAPQAAPPPPQPDPWDSGPGSAPPTPPPPAPAPQQTGTVTVNTQKGPQQWSLGLANAPACECGESAAYVQGYTNGKAWKRWACAKGAGNDWRSKCSFSQWA